MTIPADTTYPAAATDAAWQKKKTFLDKANLKTKKTGLGPKLKQAETRWNQIRWAQMDGARVGQAASLVEAKANLKRAQGAYGGMLQVMRIVGEAQAKAGSTATNFELSKESRAAATAIAKALGAAYKRLTTIKLDEFQAEVDRHTRLIAQRQAAEIEARAALTRFSANFKRQTVFEAAQARRTDDRTVEVAAATWKVTGQAQADLLGQKVSVFAQFTDGGKYVNDMKITAISGKKVTLKNAN